MFGNNQITVDLVLGKDPEMRSTNSGKAVCGASGAQSRGKREDNIPPIWYEITAWDFQARVLQTFRKGEAVRATGVLDVKEYNGKTYLKITIDSITKRVFPPRENSGFQNNQSGQQQYGGHQQDSGKLEGQQQANGWNQNDLDSSIPF